MKLDLTDNLLRKPAGHSGIQGSIGDYRGLLGWWMGGSLLAILLLIAFSPFLISNWYVASGARLLDAHADTGEAVRLFERARDWSPQDAHIERMLAQAYLQLNQTQAAIQALERAYRLQPESLLIRQELAQAYEADGQYERADALWMSVSIAGSVLLEQGELARKVGRFDDALRWYARAQQMMPGDAEPLYYAGRAYRDSEQLDRSLQILQQASSLAPNNRNAWYELGQTYAVRKEGQQAIEAYQRGLEAAAGQVGRSDFYFRIGAVQQIVFVPQEADAALESYGQALAFNEFHAEPGLKAETYYQYGVLLAGKNDWEAAVEEYRLALTTNPQHYFVHVSLAQALWQLNQWEDALAQARQAVAIDPDRKIAYRVLGDFYAAKHDDAEAAAMYMRALEIDPHDSQLHNALDSVR